MAGKVALFHKMENEIAQPRAWQLISSPPRSYIYATRPRDCLCIIVMAAYHYDGKPGV